MHRKLRDDVSSQLLLNLTVSLIGLYVVFITAGNILVYGKSTTTEVLCGINSALIQYFLLVYFGWTAAEAVQIYYWKILKAVTGEGLTQHLGHYVLKVALIVWCEFLCVCVWVLLCYYFFLVCSGSPGDSGCVCRSWLQVLYQ